MSNPYAPLYERFGRTLKQNEPLARYTVARLGGPADALLIADNLSDLVCAVALAHEHRIPWLILGGGANVLVADAGYRGLVIVNRAAAVQFEAGGRVVAESGASLSTLARRCMSRGLAGLTWAVSVPGTVGGAVINNAGAHGGDMAQSVQKIDLYCLNDQPRTELWPVERMEYEYRHSALKGTRGRYVVLSAVLELEAGHDPAALKAQADDYVAHRKQTQPPGASLGSMFKNPPGDHAGRLIEAAGLKGICVGGVQISPVHANFFINMGGGMADDYLVLIERTRESVRAQFGITLELEIEVIGVE
ncbi:MAG: UDP-N-acetylmuramate dehydrogenase [Anaerolineae bacterium]|nr:UDP-N-acetylmuramate dehydrogenase [Anaerolineae bacterium]